MNKLVLIKGTGSFRISLFGQNIFEIRCKLIQPKVYLQTPSCSRFAQQKNPNKEPYRLSISSPPQKKGWVFHLHPKTKPKTTSLIHPFFRFGQGARTDELVTCRGDLR